MALPIALSNWKSLNAQPTGALRAPYRMKPSRDDCGSPKKHFPTQKTQAPGRKRLAKDASHPGDYFAFAPVLPDPPDVPDVPDFPPLSVLDFPEFEVLDLSFFSDGFAEEALRSALAFSL